MHSNNRTRFFYLKGTKINQFICGKKREKKEKHGFIANCNQKKKTIKIVQSHQKETSARILKERLRERKREKWHWIKLLCFSTGWSAEVNVRRDRNTYLLFGQECNNTKKKENNNLHIWRAEWEKDNDSLVMWFRPLCLINVALCFEFFLSGFAFSKGWQPFFKKLFIYFKTSFLNSSSPWKIKQN